MKEQLEKALELLRNGYVEAAYDLINDAILKFLSNKQ